MLQNFDVFKDEINNCFQLRTKTDSYSLEFDDPEKEAIFLEVVNLISNNPDITLKKLQRGLKKKYNESKIIAVLQVLYESELLSPNMSSSLQTGEDTSEEVSVDEKMANTISIIGSGALANTLWKTAQSQSFKNSILYNYNDLTEDSKIESVVSQADFIIVDGNEWSPYHIELVNQYCLKHNKPWLYVSGVEGIAFKIGPLFYGKETGCYNCLISRIKSNSDYPSFLNSYENYLKRKQQPAKPDILPNSDLIYNTIANLTLLEVMKFFLAWSMPVTWKTVLSFEITTFNMTKHTLLKKPFCEVCKPILEYNPAPWLELITLK